MPDLQDPEKVGQQLLNLRKRYPNKPLHELADELFAAAKILGAPIEINDQHEMMWGDPPRNNGHHRIF